MAFSSKITGEIPLRDDAMKVKKPPSMNDVRLSGFHILLAPFKITMIYRSNDNSRIYYA